MSDVAIQIEGLGKKYYIGGEQKSYDRFGEKLINIISSPVRRVGKLIAGQSSGAAELDETIWALKEISLNIKNGEVIGIIGKNGAGKSTLLKILSRITEPTEGYADVYGRVGSLLEVGTGFHPELTGRENVYLNGAILGLRKKEIDIKFNDIVEFAEISKFLDTPVKHYSSGMYVRLAFSVAAHLEPEILIVDEVLAVGDLEFQRKCLGKMGAVTEEGRTVLFVSHNMAAVKNLCTRAIWLSEGKTRMIGEVIDVVNAYESETLQYSQEHQFEPVVNEQFGISLEGVESYTLQENGQANLVIEVTLSSNQKIGRLGIGVVIYTMDGSLVAKLTPKLTNNVLMELNGRSTSVLECKGINQYLASGDYYIDINITFPGVAVILNAQNVTNFKIPDFDHFNSGNYFSLGKFGIVPLPLKIKNNK